jgi:ribonucleoside-diphosphate reductase alpha chain
VQYDTTINEWHTCPEDGRINASNPCSEYMFLDDTACNLASLNLCKFLREGGATQGTSQREALEGELFELPVEGGVFGPGGRKLHFDIASFRHAARIWTIVLEISRADGELPERGDRAEAASSTARSVSATQTSARC